MKRTPLSLIAHWAGGEIHGDDASIDAVSNDTRTLAAGSLYVALRGERFDGHDFAANAVEQGASALLVDRLLPLEVPQVVVANTELALAKMEAEKNAMRVSELAAEYFERQILPRWKHPDILRRRIDKDINPHIGRMKVDDVKPRHIDDMLKGIVDRGAPTIATDVLRWTRRIFDYGIKRHALEINPCSAFEVADAGGKEVSRDRWLTRDELIQLFKAMRTAKGFSRQNEITFKLLLALCVRKMELCAARWEEFDLDKAVWRLPEERSKNGDAIDIPLAPPAVEWLRELKTFSCNSVWVLPARKMQNRMIPHIQESTLPVALAKVRAEMPDVPNFTIHDFRRTARTHLAALGVDPVVAERCLNHKIKGVEGIYNRHQYFDERRAALTQWAGLLVALERGEEYNVTPLRKAK